MALEPAADAWQRLGRRGVAFVHAGMHCATSIVCEEVLAQGVKLPFMFGNFPPERVAAFLERGAPADELYRLEDLRAADGRPLLDASGGGGGGVRRFGQSEAVENAALGFSYNHDFVLAGDGRTALNLAFLREAGAAKVANLRRLLSDPPEGLHTVAALVVCVGEAPAPLAVAERLAAALRALVPEPRVRVVGVALSDAGEDAVSADGATAASRRLREPVGCYWWRLAPGERQGLNRSAYEDALACLAALGVPAEAEAQE